VGSVERSFIVHADVICVKSKFFRAACSERWKEGQEKLVHLPEVDPEIFQRYVDWAYCDTLVADDDISDAVHMSVKLYLLGDLLDDVRLRNKTMKALYRNVHIDLLAPGPGGMRLIWEKTPPGSLLRNFAVNAVTTRMNPGIFEKHIEEWPAGLVQQAAAKLKHQVTTTKPDVAGAKLAEYLEVEDGA
jgi:hypothetical protein